MERDYADRLAKGYLVSPHVSASISRYRPFFIIGGVKRPGKYAYQADLTISKAVALAGGISNLAIRGAPPKLLRVNGELISGENISFDTAVFPGDFVEIPWVPPLPSFENPVPGYFEL